MAPDVVHGLGMGRLLATLVWQPAVGAWTLLALLCGMAVVVRRAWRVLRSRLGGWRAAVLVGLRCVGFGLLVSVLLDPSCEHRVRRRERSEVVLVVDRSASMGVRDRGAESGARLERATALAGRIEREIPDELRVRRYRMGTALDEVHDFEGWTATGGTDVAAAVLALAEEPRTRRAAAIVLLTDGGDSPIEPARLPDTPLLVVGIGGDPARWRNIAVDAVRAPDRVEAGARMKLEADLRGRGADDTRFMERLRSVRVFLEKERSGGWDTVDGKQVDLSGGSATVSFEADAGDAGTALWRVRAEDVQGEVSPLDNAREFPVTVAADALRVLYFSRRLGADLKFLRQELSADPAVSFSSLVQTAGDRFLLQGDAQAWEGMSALAGLPAAETLKRFEVVVLGSFAAADWTLPELEALRTYVEEGGGLLWVGGEDSFGPAYRSSPIGELIPWQAGPGEGFEHGGATVAPAPEAAARWSWWSEAAGGGGFVAEVPALNRTGAPKPGAVVWLEARTAQGTLPFLVEQPYGRGRVFALASNTTWRWALAGPPLDRLYRQLWRQTVRAAGGQGDVEGHLRVRLDRSSVLPGMRVAVEVDVLDATPQSGATARIEDPAGSIEVVGLERDVAVSGRWRGALVCRSRGTHRLSVQALRNGVPVETLERSVAVAPGEAEGGRLETDLAELDRLARRSAGLAMAEDSDEWGPWLAARLKPETATETVSVVSSGPGFLLALVALWAVEWGLRRRSNLV